eukprot:gene8063-7441_t
MGPAPVVSLPSRPRRSTAIRGADSLAHAEQEDRDLELRAAMQMVLQSHQSARQGSGVAEPCGRTLYEGRSNVMTVRLKRPSTPPVAPGTKGRKLGSLHQNEAQCMRTPGCLESLKHAG